LADAGRLDFDAFLFEEVGSNLTDDIYWWDISMEFSALLFRRRGTLFMHDVMSVLFYLFSETLLPLDFFFCLPF
jgi:hypothetical protein